MIGCKRGEYSMHFKEKTGVIFDPIISSINASSSFLSKSGARPAAEGVPYAVMKSHELSKASRGTQRDGRDRPGEGGKGGNDAQRKRLGTINLQDDKNHALTL